MEIHILGSKKPILVDQYMEFCCAHWPKQGKEMLMMMMMMMNCFCGMVD